MKSNATPTAYDILMSHWDGTLPVNLENMAKSIGIEIIPRYRMENGECGVIRRNHEDYYVIEFDACEERVRQRFAIAHEMGHFALGHLEGRQREFRDTPENFKSQIESHPKEVAANQFALKLLMPESILKFIILEKNVTEVPSLANVFGVSKSAMKFRLQDLGIIR